MLKMPWQECATHLVISTLGFMQLLVSAVSAPSLERQLCVNQFGALNFRCGSSCAGQLSQLSALKLSSDLRMPLS
jgi:hypothetical protein